MTRIASHRGGTLEYGDSTWAAFSATAALAVDEVEFDLHPTADGAIVVHHDATLERTTDTVGRIAEMTAEQIRQVTVNHAGDGPAAPLFLEELCAIFAESPVEFRCELKADAEGRAYPRFAARVVAALEEAGRLKRTVFSSFRIDVLGQIADATERPRLWLVSPPVLEQLGAPAILRLAGDMAVPEIGAHVDQSTPELIRRIEDAGLSFGCWGAHSPAQIDRALALGVKVFTTDRPRLALARRAALAEPAPEAEPVPA